MDLQFIRDRLTALRMEKGVSEAEMSRSLGHVKGYIQDITSGRRMMPMKEFLNICDYLGITPKEFFVVETSDCWRENQIRILTSYFRTLSNEALANMVFLIQSQKKNDENSSN